MQYKYLGEARIVRDRNNSSCLICAVNPRDHLSVEVSSRKRSSNRSCLESYGGNRRDSHFKRCHAEFVRGASYYA